MNANKWVVFLRHAAGLSPKELADKLKCSVNTIYAVERGTGITDRMLQRYNRYFRQLIPDDTELECTCCGVRFVSQKGIQLYCPSCNRLRKPIGCGHGISKPKYNPNPITSDTVMIVCMFTIEGQSIRYIAKELKRPVSTVQKILESAKKNGKFDYYKQLAKYGPDICLIRSSKMFRKIAGKEYKE